MGIPDDCPAYVLCLNSRHPIQKFHRTTPQSFLRTHRATPWVISSKAVRDSEIIRPSSAFSVCLSMSVSIFFATNIREALILIIEVNNMTHGVLSRRDSKRVLREKVNSLDGKTIFRFAHIGRRSSFGGVESYLKDLNEILLRRNDMRILQMYFVIDKESPKVAVEQVGQGEIIWIPSILAITQKPQMSKAQRLWAILMRLKNNQSMVSHDILLSTLNEYQIDLASFHWISEDSRTVIDYLIKRRVPFVVINHFSNKKLNRRLIKNQISGARAIGGVSSIDIPNFIRNRFVNLSDSVDTDFFHFKKASPLRNKIDTPLILLPARITEEKGHLDAVRALGRISQEGFNAVLAFAGRLGSRAFMNRLTEVISEEHVQDRVLFLGELDIRDLRNWYAASRVVVLPSIQEGLGRVLLEAQAMERPVVAYATGGIPEAVRDGGGGYLVPSKDIGALACRIRELLESPVQCNEMGKAGRAHVVNNFSLESLAVRHEEFYLSVLSRVC